MDYTYASYQTEYDLSDSEGEPDDYMTGDSILYEDEDYDYTGSYTYED